ncbi:glycosyltransferase family 2 protein [Aerococcus viridans]|uniref:glycosyltransferase family 2 protein n=1 Tax=Aerococcus viridans TaxID=1377 RepID=UPI0003082488|nr:glycosyltransferase family 2 protein [Aerococcus viridans]
MLSVIVPCYNEEESIHLFFKEMEKVKPLMDQDIEYIFVNDGSSDNSLNEMRKLAKENDQVRYISLSRNFGKEAGIYAGLKQAKGDFVTLMDVDLQDPPELLPVMLDKLYQDPTLDCVGTRRVDRGGEPPIRSFFAKKFYSLMNKISDTEFVDGARDYRLMTRQMVNAILGLTEYNRFSKGLFSWVGFNTIYLEFENRERVAGNTTWSFWSLFKYSVEGIINFSEIPLAIASYSGALMFVISIIAGLIIILRALIFGDPTAGWPSLVVIILFIGGIQLLCLGIIGKYISKIFLETKNRPIFIIKETEADLKNELNED